MTPKTSDYEAVRLLRQKFDEDLQDAERIILEKVAYGARNASALDRDTLARANSIATRFGFKPFSPYIKKEVSRSDKTVPPAKTSSTRLVIFSKKGCGHCRRSKEFLTQHNIAFEEQSLDNDIERKTFYEKSGERWHQKVSTVPQIMVEVGGIETLVGSYNDLIKSGIERTFHML